MVRAYSSRGKANTVTTSLAVLKLFILSPACVTTKDTFISLPVKADQKIANVLLVDGKPVVMLMTMLNLLTTPYHYSWRVKLQL